MIASRLPADELRGMLVTTAPEPERGRAHARLLADLDSLDRLATDRCGAAERLVDALGSELAHKLVFALTRGGRVAHEAAA